MNIFRVSVTITSFMAFFLLSVWLSTPSVMAQDILEQVIDSNDIQDMYELGENDIYRRLGRPVGRLYLRYKSSFFQRKKLAGSCTASVIADDLILTNYHCITGENGKLRLKKATLWLGYLERDSIEGVVAYDINPVPVEGKRNEKVDYAILRVRPKKGQSSVGLVRQWGKITLNSFVPKRHISLFVIHHPKGLPQKLTTGRCQTVSQITKKGNLLYSCDTIDGSSGSPVFDNNSREVIALHFGAEGQSGDDKEKKYNTGNLVRNLLKQSPILRRIMGGQKSAGNEILPQQTVPPRRQRKPYEPETVLIPSGTFLMGCVSGKDCQDDEKPVHQVTVSKFYMSKYEATVGQFKAFVKESGHKMIGDEWDCNWQNPGFLQNNSYPVVCVTWGDAYAYAKWLSVKTGEIWRLPTEAEWEYAARAGSNTKYFFGNRDADLCRYANVANKLAKSLKCEDNYTNTAPTGSFKANKFGLHDMYGNAWEWIFEGYRDYKKEAQIDPKGGKSKMAWVIRGGSWLSNIRDLRSASRGYALNNRSSNYGFRLIRQPL